MLVLPHRPKSSDLGKRGQGGCEPQYFCSTYQWFPPFLNTARRETPSLLCLAELIKGSRSLDSAVWVENSSRGKKQRLLLFTIGPNKTFSFTLK